MVSRKQEVEDILASHFLWHPEKKVTVSDDGTVTVLGNGDFWINPEIKFPWTKLPFKFGEFAGNLGLTGAGLTSLEGFPKEISEGSLHVSQNRLTNFIGGPKRVEDSVVARDNPLTSLDGFPQEIGTNVRLTYSPNLPLLRTLVANLVVLFPHNDTTDKIEKIMDKYSKEGKRGVIRCQKELISAGFEGNAKW
jgi:hypothetical protein